MGKTARREAAAYSSSTLNFCVRNQSFCAAKRVADALKMEVHLVNACRNEGWARTECPRCGKKSAKDLGSEHVFQRLIASHASLTAFGACIGQGPGANDPERMLPATFPKMQNRLENSSAHSCRANHLLVDKNFAPLLEPSCGKEQEELRYALTPKRSHHAHS